MRGICVFILVPIRVRVLCHGTCPAVFCAMPTYPSVFPHGFSLLDRGPSRRSSRLAAAYNEVPFFILLLNAPRETEWDRGRGHARPRRCPLSRLGEFKTPPNLGQGGDATRPPAASLRSAS